MLWVAKGWRRSAALVTIGILACLVASLAAFSWVEQGVERETGNATLQLAGGGLTPAQASPGILQMAKTVVAKLPKSGLGCNETAETFDYFPDGGIQSWFCHLHDVYGLATIQQMTGMPVFLTGPHQQEMNMQSRQDFGRYNPAFLLAVEKTIDDNIMDIFSGSNIPFLKEKLLPVLTDMISILSKIDQNPVCFRQDIEHYQNEIIAKGVYVFGSDEGWMDYYVDRRWCNIEGRERYTRLPYEVEGVQDFNIHSPYPYTIVGSIYLFFMRREMDGTRPIIARMIRKAHAALASDQLSPGAP